MVKIINLRKISQIKIQRKHKLNMMPKSYMDDNTVHNEIHSILWIVIDIKMWF
jgi:hypothetical protein